MGVLSTGESECSTPQINHHQNAVGGVLTSANQRSPDLDLKRLVLPAQVHTGVDCNIDNRYIPSTPSPVGLSLQCPRSQLLSSQPMDTDHSTTKVTRKIIMINTNNQALIGSPTVKKQITSTREISRMVAKPTIAYINNYTSKLSIIKALSSNSIKQHNYKTCSSQLPNTIIFLIPQRILQYHVI